CIVLKSHLLSIHFPQYQRKQHMFHLLMRVVEHSPAEVNSWKSNVTGIIRKVGTCADTYFQNFTMKVRKKLFPPFIPDHLIYPIINLGNAIVSFFDYFTSIGFHFYIPFKNIITLPLLDIDYQ